MARCKICGKLIEKANALEGDWNARVINHIERCHLPDYCAYLKQHPNADSNKVVERFTEKE